MRRRGVLAAAAAGAALSGCLDRSSVGRDGTTPSSTKGKRTPVRLTADGVTATFRVVDGHEPTTDDASASFGDGRVTVTGTVDPTGCNRPTLSAVRYHAADEVAHLEVGTTPRFGPTATVECGNASFDYRSVLRVDRGRPDAVEVVHDYQGKDDRSFTLER